MGKSAADFLCDRLLPGDLATSVAGAPHATAAKYYKSWAGPRPVIPVLNDENLNQVSWKRRAMPGNPKPDASQDIPYVVVDQCAQSIGLPGITGVSNSGEPTS